MFFFFFKQKTAYEMRISDWSSDVCSSDLKLGPPGCKGLGCPLAAEVLFRHRISARRAARARRQPRRQEQRAPCLTSCWTKSRPSGGPFSSGGGPRFWWRQPTCVAGGGTLRDSPQVRGITESGRKERNRIKEENR